jgi:seryl-tRNA synthetase
MLDLRRLSGNPEPFRAALARRDAAELFDRALELESKWRSQVAKVETLRSERKQPAGVLSESKRLASRLKDEQARLKSIESELHDVSLQLPNIPAPDVPDGETEDDNAEIGRWGTPTSFDFSPRDHVELGELHDIIDVKRAVRASGSRFYYLRGAAVELQFALVQLGLSLVTKEGFVPVIPPVLVRESALVGTGFLPTSDPGQIYATRDDLFLIGTSEVSLAALHADEIVDFDALPLRYVGYSTCFRREAGAHGKDSHGIFRVHQFDKLEMFSFVAPEESAAEHEHLLTIEQEFFQLLEIPYRIVNCCVGELSNPQAKRYDIEGWFPSQNRFRELTSASNTTDYQARRLRARTRRPGEKRSEPLHTLNGTLCAVGRTLIALIENHQDADGSVTLPDALRPFVREELWTTAASER